MDIKGKRVVITGAASGIGKETLLKLLKFDGVKILAVDLDPSRLEVSDERVKKFKCDVSSSENVDKIFKEAEKVLGGIDIFYANAGFAYYEEIKKPDWKRIEKIFQTNVFSAIYGLQKVQSEYSNPVYYIITASAMSFLSIPGYALYSATKAAVHSFAEAFQFELKKPHRLMIVYPIATRTNFFDAAGKKVPVPFPSQTPKQVASAVISGIRWNKKRVLPSRIFALMMFADRFLIYPLRMYQIIENWKRRKALN
ncbi:SDR family NAD(P)-dependent oxidoreductase [Leptospira venezuelensis]|uniref:SDR family NAD(P)-dependent oxidoreductase n=1 Tax=Leptospira venezuelensis TaxID=1958811 RepID=UPI000A3B0062|nr:SDR family NAD(P)-dependent oxidoreductase [Leptospira venezuelensis]